MLLKSGDFPKPYLVGMDNANIREKLADFNSKNIVI